jgi:hypothetical protein
VVRDIQITDMTFDKEIIDSMARVVSSKNLLAAASNEGAALLVKRTKDAEAEAAYKTIGAEADKKASALRGEGLALIPQEYRRRHEGCRRKPQSSRRGSTSFCCSWNTPMRSNTSSDHAQGKVIFMDNGAAAPARVAQGIFGMLGEATGTPAPPPA